MKTGSTNKRFIARVLVGSVIGIVLAFILGLILSNTGNPTFGLIFPIVVIAPIMVGLAVSILIKSDLKHIILGTGLSIILFLILLFLLTNYSYSELNTFSSIFVGVINIFIPPTYGLEHQYIYFLLERSIVGVFGIIGALPKLIFEIIKRK